MIRYKFVRIIFHLLIVYNISLGFLFAEEVSDAGLNYAKALEQMLNLNELLKSVEMEKEKSEYDRKAAFGLYFPTVDLNFTYTHLSDPIELDFRPLRDSMIAMDKLALAAAGNYGDISTYENLVNNTPALAPNNFIHTLQKKDFWTLGVTVKQPVFTGGKITAANKAAKARFSAASAKVRYTQYALMTELTQRYYGVRLAAKVVEVREEVLDGMKQHLDNATKMKESGIIPNAEKLHAEVAYSEAEREYKKALRDADTVAAGLKNILSTDKQFVPISELFISDDIQDLDFYKSKAAELNPVLAQMRANAELAKQGYMSELARYSPNIFLFGSKNIANNNLSKSIPEWFVGAGATMSIFDGFSSYNSLKAASAVRQSVDEGIKKAMRDIDTLVEKNYNELMKDYEQIQSLNKSLEFAEEYVRVRSLAFQSGFSTSIDVVDARLNLSKVKIEQLYALYEFDVSLARLLEVCGLSEQFSAYQKNARLESEILSRSRD